MREAHTHTHTSAETDTNKLPSNSFSTGLSAETAENANCRGVRLERAAWLPDWLTVWQPVASCQLPCVLVARPPALQIPSTLPTPSPGLFAYLLSLDLATDLSFNF